MLFLLLLGVVWADLDYPMEAEVEWDLSGRWSSSKGTSAGVLSDAITGKQSFWVKQDTTIELFDTKTAFLDEKINTPVRMKTMNTGSSCTNSFTMFSRNKFISMHGNDKFCTCAWTVDNPCPHLLMIDDVNSALPAGTISNAAELDGKFEFYGNTERQINEFDDVRAEFAFAEPEMACTNLTNPETGANSIKGKFCIARRGGCFFQTKYVECMKHGAVGVIVVNREDNLFGMWVEQPPTVPFVIIRKTIGDLLANAVNKGVMLQIGKQTGVSSPQPEYSGPDALSLVNYYSGKRTLEDRSFAGFTTVETLSLDVVTDYMYAVNVDGTTKTVVLDFDSSPMKVVGEFDTGNTFYHSFFYKDTATGKEVYAYHDDVWASKIAFYKMDGANLPTKVGELTFPLCGGSYLDGSTVGSDQRYIYVWGSIHNSTACGPYNVVVYDISNPADPKQISKIPIKEVRDGTGINSMQWGYNDVVLITLHSGGAAWYDFKDPLSPTALAHIDVNEVENTYTLGTFFGYSTSYGWILEDHTEENTNFHGITLKPFKACKNFLQTQKIGSGCANDLEHGKICSPGCAAGYVEGVAGKYICDKGVFVEQTAQVCNLGVCQKENPGCNNFVRTEMMGAGCSNLIEHGKTCSPGCAAGYVEDTAGLTTCNGGVFQEQIAQVCKQANAGCNNFVRTEMMGTGCSNLIEHGKKCSPGCASGYIEETAGSSTCDNGVLQEQIAQVCKQANAECDTLEVVSFKQTISGIKASQCDAVKASLKSTTAAQLKVDKTAITVQSVGSGVCSSRRRRLEESGSQEFNVQASVPTSSFVAARTTIASEDFSTALTSSIKNVAPEAGMEAAGLQVLTTPKPEDQAQCDNTYMALFWVFLGLFVMTCVMAVYFQLQYSTAAAFAFGQLDEKRTAGPTNA